MPISGIHRARNRRRSHRPCRQGHRSHCRRGSLAIGACAVCSATMWTMARSGSATGSGIRPLRRARAGTRRRPSGARLAARARAAHSPLQRRCPRSVNRFADALGITHAHARQTPEAKLAYVRQLQMQGRGVAMVGDGLNDAPVLAGADVSMAMGEGAALAQRAADLVLTSPSLTRIPAAISLARRTERIVRQNFAWALATTCWPCRSRRWAWSRRGSPHWA